MEKHKVDGLMTDYTQKLFGFALKKTRSIDEAEELAARLTLEVYAALLQADEVVNPDGYVWRVACHTFARYVGEAHRGAHRSLDDISLAAPDDFTERVANEEEYARLRQEITYLSRTQREVVRLHYFENRRLSDIAATLSLPLGTVKWHLYDAKNNLKKGLMSVRTTGTLGLNPVEFDSMGHGGSPGPKGDTADFLRTRLAQNVAFAAYYTPKTVNEIAEELGVSPLFIEDELAPLVEFGFIDQLPAGKYRTNIYITVPNAQRTVQELAACQRAAEQVCEIYIPRVLAAVEEITPAECYCPDGDRNLLRWAAVLYALGNCRGLDTGVDMSRFVVKRPDGGEFIAYATVKADVPDMSHYGICGDMYRNGGDKYPLSAWQVDTFADDRTDLWRDNLNTDYAYLYEWLTGALKKEPSQIEKYRRLRDKGYLTEEDEVNIVVYRGEQAAFAARLPEADDALRGITRALGEEIYTLSKPHYPAHMQEFCYAYSMGDGLANNMLRISVIDRLLEQGILTLPTEQQKSGLATMLFCDVLPE